MRFFFQVYFHDLLQHPFIEGAQPITSIQRTVHSVPRITHSNGTINLHTRILIICFVKISACFGLYTAVTREIQRSLHRTHHKLYHIVVQHMKHRKSICGLERLDSCPLNVFLWRLIHTELLERLDSCPLNVFL